MAVVFAGPAEGAILLRATRGARLVVAGKTLMVVVVVGMVTMAVVVRTLMV